MAAIDVARSIRRRSRGARGGARASVFIGESVRATTRDDSRRVHARRFIHSCIHSWFAGYR
jgi:hypothetical protein